MYSPITKADQFVDLKVEFIFLKIQFSQIWLILSRKSAKHKLLLKFTSVKIIYFFFENRKLKFFK